MDVGAMFENFVINEVKKEVDYLDLDYNVNYWRLKSASEVDLILSNASELVGVEIKYSGGTISRAFRNRYPHAKLHLTTHENIM